MRRHGIRGIGLLLCALLANAGIAGCSKKSTAPKPEGVSDTKPNANNRVTSETVLGAAQHYTTLYTIRPADDGSFGFRGAYNGAVGVGALNADGSVRWFQSTIFQPNAIVVLPSTAVVPGGLVSVGFRDLDGDGKSDVGDVELHSSSGVLLSHVVVSYVGSTNWLNTVAMVGDSALVAGGSESIAGVEHPLLVGLNLRTPGLLQSASKATLAGPGYFLTVVNRTSSPTELVLAATSGSGLARSLRGLRAPWPALAPIAVEWTQDLTPTIGAWSTSSLVLRESGGNLYLAGGANDGRKPSPAGFRASGVAASYTGSGAFRWQTVVSLSSHSESFYGLSVGVDAVYAVGHAAEYGSGSPEELFGYGMIAKLNLDTGAVIDSFMIGDDHYQSGFNTAHATPTGLVCGGFTKRELTSGAFRGWFTTVDVSPAIEISVAPVPAAARVGGAAHPATTIGRGRISP